MPRPARQPKRSEIAPEEVEFYDKVVARAADPARKVFVHAQQMGDDAGDMETDDDAGYYGRLLLSPEMAYHLSELGRLVRSAGERGDTYTHAQRELVDQVLSIDLKTNVIQAHHIPDALAAGVRMEAIEALRYGNEEALNDEERELTAFIREVINGSVDDGTWNRVEARMGERGVIEYTIFILLLQFIMRMQDAVKLPNPSDEEIDALIDGLRDGSIPVPEFTTRAG